MNTIEQKTGLLNNLFEGLGNGILLLSCEGKTIYSNSEAERISHIIDPKSTTSAPKAIWMICRQLIESHHRCPDHSRVIESEICLDKWKKFRVRVKWLSCPESHQFYLLVMLENQYQSLQNQALFEADQYGLTPAETRVWVLRRTNHTREEIGSNLYIALNTVKKHLKSIKAKQEREFYRDSLL